MNDRIAKLERALHIIHTWATFFVDTPDDRERTLRDIIRKCEEVLHQEAVTCRCAELAVSRPDPGLQAQAGLHLRGCPMGEVTE